MGTELIWAVLAGLAAGRIDHLVVYVWSWFGTGRLDRKSDWLEYVPKGELRQFSVGRFRYSLRRREWEFSGTNFNNDGSPFCHWRTVKSLHDTGSQTFYYVFHTEAIDSPQTTSTGFGVIKLKKEGRRMIPQHGYYNYTQPNGDPISVQHTMQQIDHIPSEYERDASELFRKYLPKEWANRNKESSNIDSVEARHL